MQALVALRSAVRASLEKYSAGDVILVAVSGGADSLALAEVAKIEGEKLALKIIGVTIDHQLQSGSSAQAEKVCSQISIPCTIEKVKVEITDGLEASARRARYAALESCAKENGAVAVLLGHTKDDQAETVLLGLARGSGARSLAGMSEVNGIYVRPFLEITRLQTLQACEELNLKPWNDPHNEDETFLRVKVRKHVLPTMERELGPGIREALTRIIGNYREVSHIRYIIDKLIQKCYNSVLNTKGVIMQARNYIHKYSKTAAKAGYSNYYNIQATTKWVEYQLDVYDMSNMLMSADFNTKMDLLDALAVAERKRDYMYRHPNFNLKEATNLFRLVKDSPKLVKNKC